ncbi:hypothetical protein MXB_693 [Myxobolus squamalis]|nr:hypothetical protein MXB_693 [Myxobolus squamalis]
MAIAINNMNIN